MRTAKVERETERGKRAIRVPLIAGFAVVQRRGLMSCIFDIGKAKPHHMDRAGVALLGYGQEVIVENPRRKRATFRRYSR